jgi:Mrp family chromosome partitioning ATPase
METATELLASGRMADVVAQLAAPDGRRIVLFDSPPLLLSTESHALATSAGQVVLVVRAEVTAQQAVRDAIDAVGTGKPVSLILNQTSSPPSAGYFGYGSYGDAPAPQGEP